MDFKPIWCEDIEKYVLGACLFDGDLLDHAIRVLSVDAFYSSAHRDIWQATIDLVLGHGRTMDIPALGDELKAQGTYERCGGAAYLWQLYEASIAPADFPAHVEALLDFQRRRAFFLEQRSVLDDLVEGRPSAELAARAQDAAGRLVGQGKEQSVSEVVDELLSDGVQDHIMLSCAPFGPTGIDIGATIGPLFPGQYVVVAAYTSTGKTAFLSSLVTSMCYDGIPVGWVSLENSPQECVARIEAQHARLPTIPILLRQVRSEEKRRALERAAEWIRAQRLWIRRLYGPSETDLAQAVRQMIQKHGVKVVLVDFVQKVRTPGRNRNLEISGVVSSLIAAAGSDATLLLASQISREGMKEERPRLWHLRDSGVIENEARAVMILSRQTKGEPPRDGTGKQPILLDLAKNTLGPTGECPATLWGAWSCLWPGDATPPWTLGPGGMAAYLRDKEFDEREQVEVFG